MDHFSGIEERKVSYEKQSDIYVWFAHETFVYC